MGAAGFGHRAAGAPSLAGLALLRMRNGKGAARAPVLQFTNCRILRGRRLLR